MMRLFKIKKTKKTRVQVRSRHNWYDLDVVYDAWGDPRVYMPVQHGTCVVMLNADGTALTEWSNPVSWKHIAGPAVTFPAKAEAVA